MIYNVILVAVALIALYFVFKAKRYQREHQDANQNAKAKLDALQADAERACGDWAQGSNAKLETKTALKQGLSQAFEFGAELVGERQSVDSKAIKAVLADYLEGERNTEARWALYHRALHCAVLLGQKAAQPKMAGQIDFQISKLREALARGDVPENR
ncbi:hypothetical protein [Ferrimonas pelagia]|uniref:Uncharacterized protein n=1 Tax=Ferrimonas pelagia TaxID=1177826 RepID=A0ABP9F0M1_9GAMM